MAPEISKAVGHKAAPLDVTWNQRDLLLYVVRTPITRHRLDEAGLNC
jgi:hypothetical protein